MRWALMGYVCQHSREGGQPAVSPEDSQRTGVMAVSPVRRIRVGSLYNVQSLTRQSPAGAPQKKSQINRGQGE